MKPNNTEIRNSLLLWLLIAGGLIITFFTLFQQILMPFIVALIIAYILKPVVEALLEIRFSRTVSATLLVGGFLIVLIAAIFFAFPFVKNELLYFAQKLPGYFTTLQAKLTPYATMILSYVDPAAVQKIQGTLGDYFGDMISWSLKMLAGLFSSTLIVANLISLIVITPLITFYVLRDWPRIESSLHDLLPLSAREKSQTLMREIQQTLSGYFRGQASVCCVMVIYYIIGLYVIGLDFAFIIGFVSGILTFIPYVGFLVSFLAAFGVALAQFASIKGVLLVTAVYLSAHALEAFFLTPTLVGDRIGLHPVWIIFSLMAGGLIAGISGVLLAVPVAAVINILLKFILNIYLLSPAFLGRPPPSSRLKSAHRASESKQGGI